MTAPRVLGFIGGSGLYDIDTLEGAERRIVASPWGRPSGPILFGRIGDVEVRFLARHGEGHAMSPNHVDYRANIDAMKRSGVTDIISISACGSLREGLAPGAFVMVDQFIDRALSREHSFFGDGCVAHVSMADPICPTLSDAAVEACRAAGVDAHRGGVYLCMLGPQFSTRAESNLYRSWGCDVIGMTNATEARLAREAEIPYATVAMVTDYDCWREEEAHVEVAAILEVMHRNTQAARRIIPDIARRLGPARTPSPTGAETCLDTAIITPESHRDPALLARLDAVAGRILTRMK